MAHLPNVSVMQYEGLATEAARKAGASVLVRGLRGAVDADYEYNMAQMNRRIAPEIETVLLFSDPETALISSSNVRELLRYRLPVDDLVPLPVQMNRRIAPEIETVLLFSDPETALISSSNVRELLRYRLPVDDLVPLPVNAWLQKQSLAAGTDTHQKSAAGNHLQSKEEGK